MHSEKDMKLVAFLSLTGLHVLNPIVDASSHNIDLLSTILYSYQVCSHP